jgi:hypothetical protein
VRCCPGGCSGILHFSDITSSEVGACSGSCALELHAGLLWDPRSDQERLVLYMSKVIFLHAITN